MNHTNLAIYYLYVDFLIFECRNVIVDGKRGSIDPKGEFWEYRIRRGVDLKYWPEDNLLLKYGLFEDQ